MAKNDRTIFDIDNDLRVCDSAHIRVVCGSPSDPTWRSYRRLIGVALKAKKLTLRQSYLLWIVASLYANGERKLTRPYVFGVASELLNYEPRIEDVMQRLTGKDGVEGRDLPDAISSLSDEGVSIRTLYRVGKKRNMPNFSLKQRYSPIQIRRFARAVRKRKKKPRQQPKAKAG